MNILYKTAFVGLVFVGLVGTSTLAATYTGGATFVARDDGLGQLLDAGGVLCHAGTGDGVGGACIAWDTLDNVEEFLRVEDALAGLDVAFQVCVDNSGDGLCGGPRGLDSVGGVGGGGCPDTILFSHDDAGAFFNPLGPLPTGFPSGCTGGFPGWVVFLCEGVHDDNTTAHQHAVTTGHVTPATSGSGSGTFCGGIAQQDLPPKPYVIVDEEATAADVEAAVNGALRALDDALEPVANLPPVPDRP